MITCHVRYEIEPSQIEAFERFALRWMQLVERHAGSHHGYFLPSEGASDVAYALFSFPSLADYERYRGRFGVDRDFRKQTASATSPGVFGATSGRSFGPYCLRPAPRELAITPSSPKPPGCRCGAPPTQRSC
jgi:hypothetical protein